MSKSRAGFPSEESTEKLPELSAEVRSETTNTAPTGEGTQTPEPITTETITVKEETGNAVKDNVSIKEDTSVIETNAVSDTDRLANYLDSLTSYEANFQQQRYSPARDLLDTTSGRFVLNRPNQFIWQTFSPFEQKIVSNGTVLWTIDVDLEQVIINDVDERVENAPIYLLASNQADISNLFHIQYQQMDEKNEYFILSPKDESGAFEGVRLGFKDGILSTLELSDSLGQLTLVTMTNVRNNPILDIEQFDYTPDADYDIIDSRETNP